MIHYHSTRGAAPVLNFEDAVLAGLATDGGLYLPQTIPSFRTDEIAALAGLPYVEVAVRIIGKFTEGTLAEDDLRAMLVDAYGTFRHSAIAPLKQLDERQWLLELFHGPTLAFKDFALQVLGRLLEHFLRK